MPLLGLPDHQLVPHFLLTASQLSSGESRPSPLSVHEVRLGHVTWAWLIKEGLVQNGYVSLTGPLRM